LCSSILEKSPETTDLHSELVGFNSFLQLDFEDLKSKIKKLETDCQLTKKKLEAFVKHGRDDLNVKISKLENASLGNLKAEANQYYTSSVLSNYT
jgi:hypothetical protein